MNRMAWVVVVALLGVVRIAEAEVHLLGWTADGRFVIDMKDAKKASAFGKGQERFFAQCAPVDFAVAIGDKAPAACTHCGKATDDPAKTCGLTVKPAKIASSLTSPDKKLTLKEKTYCVQQSGGGDCIIELAFGKLGVVERRDAGPTAEPQSDVWFRPDSNAVMLDLWNVDDDKVRDDTIVVIDVTDLRQRGDVPKLVAARVAEQLSQPANSALYTKSAALFTDEAARSAIAPAALADAVKATTPMKPGKVDVGVTIDGRAAWASFTTTTSGGTWRVTEMFAREGGEWRITGGLWSRAMPDKDADAKALAGQLGKPANLTTTGKDDIPKNLVDEVDQLRDKPDATWTIVAKGTDVHVIGTAPNERLTGDGKLFEKGWRAWATGGMTIGPVLSASANKAGWMIMNIELAKTKGGKKYVLPIRAWMMVDLTRETPENDGVVVVHLSAAK